MTNCWLNMTKTTKYMSEISRNVIFSESKKQCYTTWGWANGVLGAGGVYILYQKEPKYHQKPKLYRRCMHYKAPISYQLRNPYSRCHNNTRRVKLRSLPRGVDSSCLDGWPGGWNPIEVPNPAAGKNVDTSRFSTRKPKFCNIHTYNFHVPELLNLIFGWPGGCQKKVWEFGPPPV